MRWIGLLVAGLLVARIGLLDPGYAAGAFGSDADELYDLQVQYGAEVYASSCARCHGEHGEGVGAPMLIGPRAVLRYRTAERLVALVSTAMPWNAPGSLAVEGYDAVVAYVLEQNGYNADRVLVDAASAPCIIFGEPDQ